VQNPPRDERTLQRRLAALEARLRTLETSPNLPSVPAYTADHTAGPGDDVMEVSAASGNVTITLPSAVGAAGKSFIVKRADSTTVNTVTVAAQSGETIDGAVTFTRLWAQYTYVRLISDGTVWLVIGQSAIDEPWQTASFASAQWSNRGAGFPTFRFRRLAGSTDNVQIVGDIVFTANGTTGLASGAPIATLPAVYQPANEQKVSGA
jgi:hypothetical protein